MDIILNKAFAKMFKLAAERAFVTQQCLSDHIKKLEDSYRVKFFTRKPKLALTPEGEAMLRYVSRLNVLDAELQITLADTRDLEPLLLSGELDIFLGVSTEKNVMFTCRKLHTENLYLIIPEEMLKRYFPGSDSYSTCLKIFAQGVDLKAIHDIPFVLSHEGSRSTFGVRQYYKRNGLELNMPVCISDFNIHLKLCRTGKYATVAPYMHLHQLIDNNDDDVRLLVFPLLNIEKKYDIEIITHRDAPKLKVIHEFSRVLEDACQECCRDIEDYLQTCSQLCETENVSTAL